MLELTEKDIKRFWSKVDKKSEDECWEWLGCKAVDGYGQIKIKNKMYRAHRISWTMQQGEIPEHNSYHGYCVCHACDNRACVNPAHLFLGTHQENMNDRDEKCRGVISTGEQQGQHKLTEAQVAEIREKYIPRKYSTTKLAEEYNVSQTVIYCVIKYKTWKHIVVNS